MLLTPYGIDGPYAAMPAADLTIAALGGPMSIQGVAERAPVRVSVPQVWRHAGAEAAGLRVVRGPRGTRPDGNGVDRDQEVVHMARNAGAFQDAASVLSRIYALRRMAATGELS